MSTRPQLNSLERTQWIVLTILLLGSLIFWNTKITGGVFLGGIVVIVNFKVLRKIIEQTLGSQGPSKIVAVKYALKALGLVGAVVAVAVFLREIIDLVAFLAGLLVVFLAITVEGLRGLGYAYEDDGNRGEYDGRP
jgi:hypothetical protein